MAKISVIVADRIREFRKLRRLSQVELAEHLNSAKNTVSRWETRAHTPSVEDLERLADVLGVTVTDFFPERNISEKAAELLNAINGLNESDLDELIRYAYFRRATASSR